MQLKLKDPESKKELINLKRKVKGHRDKDVHFNGLEWGLTNRKKKKKFKIFSDIWEFINYEIIFV